MIMKIRIDEPADRKTVSGILTQNGYKVHILYENTGTYSVNGQHYVVIEEAFKKGLKDGEESKKSNSKE